MSIIKCKFKQNYYIFTHRTVDINVYKYDEVELTETVVISNTLLKPFKPLEKTVAPFSVVNRGIQIDNYQLEVNLPNNVVVKIGIYDITGREIINKIHTKQGTYKLNLSKYPKGIYFINLKTTKYNIKKDNCILERRKSFRSI